MRQAIPLALSPPQRRQKRREIVVRTVIGALAIGLLLAGIAHSKPSKNDVQCAETVAEAVAACEARHANEQPASLTCPPEPKGYHVYKQNRRGELRPTRTYLVPEYDQ